MKKITRMILISAIFVTSGLTAKVANENYKAVITNDERIHKAYELAKKPNKAAVLEAIVDAANAESAERIRDAVILDPEETSKTPKVVRVTTSAGVSPLSPTMNEKTVNKAEEFIEKVAHPAEVVTKKNLDFTLENLPIQELTYEFKDIFPEFEEITAKVLTYKITLPEKASTDFAGAYFFDINGTGENAAGKELNAILYANDDFAISAVRIIGKVWGNGSARQAWLGDSNSTNIVKLYPESRTIDYSPLAPFKDSDEKIPGIYTTQATVPTCKEVYDFLAGVEMGKYPLLTGIS